MRGVLTKEVQEIAKKHIGREIDTTELRLIPYIQYIMVNEQKIESIRVNLEDRKILQKWRKKGYIKGGSSELSITKEFWDFMCEILFQSYVKQDGERIK